jgi:hypothetical protein
MSLLDLANLLFVGAIIGTVIPPVREEDWDGAIGALAIVVGLLGVVLNFQLMEAVLGVGLFFLWGFTVDTLEDDDTDTATETRQTAGVSATASSTAQNESRTDTSRSAVHQESLNAGASASTTSNTAASDTEIYAGEQDEGDTRIYDPE